MVPAGNTSLYSCNGTGKLAMGTLRLIWLGPKQLLSRSFNGLSFARSQIRGSLTDKSRVHAGLGVLRNVLIEFLQTFKLEVKCPILFPTFVAPDSDSRPCLRKSTVPPRWAM